MRPLFINFRADEQDWLIERMRALDYRSDPMGIRFGLAYMGGQADTSGVSPLLMAGRQRDIEIIRILLGDLNRKKDQENS